MEARTFISAYRYDPVRVLFVRRVLPVFVWLEVFGALLVPTLILASLWQDVAPENRQRLLLLIGGTGALLLTAPAIVQWLVWMLRRDMFETRWRLDEAGVTRTIGARTAFRSWEEVTGLNTVGIGRVQMARLRAASGNLWFDAAMIEDVSPPPRLRWHALNMSIVYADGRERPLEIEECELYQAIAERLFDR